MPAPNSISTDKLSRIIGTPRAPLLLDVRSEDDFGTDPRLIPGAIRTDDQAMAVMAALTAITAAVVGVILNLAVWFALHVIFRQVEPFTAFGLRLNVPVLSSIDWASAILIAAAMVAVFRFRMSTGAVLLGCAAAGLAVYGFRELVA